jgi:TRAP-type transport system periplasmic protein
MTAAPPIRTVDFQWYEITGGVMMNQVKLRVGAVAVLAASLMGCGESDTSTKAGSATSPVTLRIGTEDPAGRATEGQIEEFSRHVQELTNGSVIIEPVFRAAGNDFSREWDQIVARKVVSGELDMGVIPARAWDTEGVNSLRALNAPFLVTSDALTAEVVTSDLADVMLAGLNDIGVTGLALLPEGMRRVFVLDDPDINPFDLEGRVVRAPKSATTFAVFEALGATADDFNGDEVSEGIAAGTIHAAETSFALAGNLPEFSTTSAHEALFPKVNSLVANSAAFDRLSDDQQDALRVAASRTVQWSIEQLPADVDAATRWCEAGGRIVAADDALVAETMSAVEPVYAELEADEVTRTLIERIRAMKSELPTPPAIEPCEPADREPDDASPEPALTIDGIHRQDVTVEHLMKYGVSEAKARQEAGVQTWTLDRGDLLLEYQDNVCRGTYAVDEDRVTFRMTSGCTGDWVMTASIEPDRITWTDVEVLPPWNSPEFQLELEAFASVPWIRVGDVPGATGAEPEFSEGSFRAEITAETLLDAGLNREDALNHAGMWTLTFRDGVLLVDDVNERTGERSTGEGVYCVVGARVQLGLLGTPPACGDFWSAGWTLEGDQLRFVEVRSGHGSDRLIEALFGSTPFVRID